MVASGICGWAHVAAFAGCQIAQSCGLSTSLRWSVLAAVSTKNTATEGWLQLAEAGMQDRKLPGLLELQVSPAVRRTPGLNLEERLRELELSGLIEFTDEEAKFVVIGRYVVSCTAQLEKSYWFWPAG